MTDRYVRPTNGSDANTGLSFAQAYQTTAKAITVAVAGDTVRQCNEANEAITTGLVTVGAGSRDSLIRWTAGDSTDGSPLDGTGKYTISCNLSSGNDAWEIATGDVYQVFQDIAIITTGGSTDEGWKIQPTNCTFVRCSIAGAWTEGFNSTSDTGLIDCEASGCAIGFINGGSSNLLGCRAHDCTGTGFVAGGTGIRYINTASYDNDKGYDTLADNSVLFFKSLAFGNTGDGFDVGGTAYNSIINCTSSGNGGYGYNFTATGIWSNVFGFNHSYNNTSGHTNESGDWADQGLGGNIEGDPLFTSIVDGSENFTPLSGSPLEGAGFPEQWGASTVGFIGPLQAAAAGGGGGGTSMIGPGGGMIGAA